MIKHESFAKGLDALLFPQPSNTAAETIARHQEAHNTAEAQDTTAATPTGATEATPAATAEAVSVSSPLAFGGACHDVVSSQRHNSGDEASRSHLPKASFYRDLLLMPEVDDAKVTKEFRKGSEEHSGLSDHSSGSLLCRLVDLHAQDYACFDYPLPPQCRSLFAL